MATTQTAGDLRERLAHFSTYECTPAEAFALFREAREAGHSVFFSEKHGGYYTFLDYADVKAAHGDWETYHSGPQVLRPFAERPRFPPLEYDPPEHTAWRELFAQVLNPQAPKLHEDSVREDVVQVIEQLRTQGTFDLQADFAEPIPLLTLSDVIGFDREKRADVRRFTVEMHAAGGDPQKLQEVFMAFGQFGAAEVYDRLEHPREDFLTDLARAQIDGQPIPPMELGAAMNSFLNAGHGTTVSGLTSLLWEVLRSPEIKQRLIDDPSQIPAAVEESMRLHTPFFGLYRTTTKPLTVGGVEIPEGSGVLMMWAAANRDPKVFPNPDEFDLDRELGRNRLMTFGFGLHACMGQPLARMEMKVALEELLGRLPEIELVDPDEVKHEFAGMETCLIKSLPARINA
ncbi:MAG TPA: cytochrome P450 [Solirubrobacteraceae bacterium]|jgi:cytochrome P450|nr:cytochrome P450 [Solirubrobacteraceae bacterium]